MKEELKKFDIEKANELLKFYKEKRFSGKISFLNELISYQHFFGDLSILNCDLSLKNHQTKTIKSVLSDLGYTLDYTPVHYVNHGFDGGSERRMLIKFK